MMSSQNPSSWVKVRMATNKLATDFADEQPTSGYQLQWNDHPAKKAAEIAAAADFVSRACARNVNNRLRDYIPLHAPFHHSG